MYSSAPIAMYQPSPMMNAEVNMQAPVGPEFVTWTRHVKFIIDHHLCILVGLLWRGDAWSWWDA